MAKPSTSEVEVETEAPITPEGELPEVPPVDGESAEEDKGPGFWGKVSGIFKGKKKTKRVKRTIQKDITQMKVTNIPPLTDPDWEQVEFQEVYPPKPPGTQRENVSRYTYIRFRGRFRDRFRFRGLMSAFF